MTNRGSGYESDPSVTITGGGGTGASATARITARLTSPGFEIHIQNRKGNWIAEGRRVANIFMENYLKNFPGGSGTDWPNCNSRGFKDRTGWYVIQNECPSILLEEMFMTHYPDFQMITDDDFLEDLADCHVESIVEINDNGY